MTRAPLLRPEFGPTLPDLLSRRLSVSRRAIAVAGVLVLVAIVVAIKIALGIGKSQVTVHGSPSFNLVYKTGELRRARLQPGELVRLEGRRRHVAVVLTVRRADLPPFSGDVLDGEIPLYASTYVSRLRAQLPHFAFDGEGKVTINKIGGYEIDYESGRAGHRTYWHDVFLMPDANRGDQAVVMRLGQTFSGPTGARGQALVQAGKQAYHSFRFGTSRPLFQG